MKKVYIGAVDNGYEQPVSAGIEYAGLAAGLGAGCGSGATTLLSS